MTERLPISGNNSRIVATMTPEMCKAIKRQETNCGIDYWKHSVNSDRIQPTFRRLTHVNLDFPGVFLPNVNPTQSLRTNRKSHKSRPTAVGRSKTSLMPEIKPGRSSDVNSKVGGNDSTKKSPVTDITCLQLADTLLSYNKTPFSGLFGTAVRPSRYSDYVEDENDNDANTDENCSSTTSYDTITDERETPSVVSCADDNILSPLMPRDLLSPSGRTSRNEPNDSKLKPQSRPQKSILKNGNSSTTIVIRPNSATSISETYNSANKPSVFSYHLPNSKTIRRLASENRVTSASMHPTIQNDLPVGHRHLRNIPIRNDFSRTVRNIPIRLEKQNTVHGSVHDISGRKRSVRFNAAHQVHEYTPCEPVSYC